ncbi:MAG: enoyl-CoA hydratase [Alphaproteobacteria bacterium]
MPDTQPGAAAADMLLREDRDGVAVLTLNRPASRNALSRAMLAALKDAFDALAHDGSVGAVVVQAEGPAFSAGHDLKEIRANRDRDFYERLMAECAAVMTRVVRLPKPVVAAVEGVATAAGCQFVASCDLAVAGAGARFATPGVNIGLFCSTPMVALSRNVAPKHAMEMLLTGDMIDAEHAARIGLVNRVVPQEEARTAAFALARQIATKSPYTLKVGKEAFYRQLELGLDAAYAYASDVMTQNLMARDAEEGIAAFVEKREPKWEGN